ncbi:MAG: hypothetical protein ACREGJ_00765 [Candidatus Saccharimonadales bacterium]
MNDLLKREWYLDLDRTLFDTERFVLELFKVAGRIYREKGVRRMRLLTDLPHQIRYVGDLSYYPFFDHLAEYGVDTQEAKKLLYEALKDNDFLYKDAHELLDWLESHGIQPHILTFGDKDYQSFKISLAPRLQNLPVTIVQESKGAFLARQACESAILVDDKLVTDLPEWCTGALLTRKKSVAGYNGLVIKNLNDLMRFVE